MGSRYDDRLVETDVPSKDLAAYMEAQRRDDRQRVQQIVDRAARRGKKGSRGAT